MFKVMHCADLHLSSSERDYSFAVLNEIIDLANTNNVNFLLFAGDTFDSFTELDMLKNDFANSIRHLHKGCEIFLLAGNHEEHGRNNRKIVSCNLGIPPDNIIDVDSRPFRLIVRDSLEFLAVPHQSDYKGYTDWNVPEKKSKIRMAIAHASNDDLAFTGIDDEEDKAGVMDSDLFERFHVDYAALGHIHKSGEKRINSVYMAYPGSPRVWRKDESGMRCVNFIECSDTIKTTKREINSAGQFRKYTVNLTLDGKPDVNLKNLKDEWSPNDWIWVDLFGLVEDSLQIDNLESELINEFAPIVRRFNLDRNGVESCSGISNQGIAKKFLEIWEGKKPGDIGDEREVWKGARAIGLKKIKERMETMS